MCHSKQKCDPWFSIPDLQRYDHSFGESHTHLGLITAAH